MTPSPRCSPQVALGSGWFFKLIAGPDLGLPSSVSGIRHLLMDVSHRAKEVGKTTAVATLSISVALTAVLGAQARSACSAIPFLPGKQPCLKLRNQARIVTGASYGLRDWMAQRVTPC